MIKLGGGPGGGGPSLTLAGNTSGVLAIISSGTLTLAGGNNITLSQNGNAVTLSGGNTSQFLTTAALSQDSSKYAFTGFTTTTVGGAVVAGTHNTDGLKLAVPSYLTTAGLSGDSTKYAGVGETVGTVAGTDLGLTVNTDGVSIKHPNWLTVQTVESQSAGMSNLGNTSGTSGIASGAQIKFLLAGGDNITLSQSLDGASGTITISGGAGGAAGSNTFGMSNIGNTSGITGVVSGSAIRYLFAGGDNITLSQSLDVLNKSGTLTISAGNQGSITAGMSNIGNTSGTTGVVSGANVRILFAGGDNITLSQSLNGSSATLTVSGANAGAQNMNFWQNFGVNGSATDAMAQTQVTYNNLHVFQLDIGNNIFPGNMTVKTVLVDMTGNVTTSIGAYTVSMFLGIYTINASTALSLLTSGSVSFGTSFAVTSGTTTVNHQASINGRRYFTMDGSLFGGLSLTLSQTLYYGGILWRSSSASASLSMFGAILGESGQRSGTFGTVSVTNTFIGALPYQGVFSTTTAALPYSIASEAIRKTAIADIFIPHIMFNNIQASF